MNSDCAVRSCSLSLQNPSRKAQSVHAKKSPGFTDAHDSLRLLRSQNQQLLLNSPPHFMPFNNFLSFSDILDSLPDLVIGGYWNRNYRLEQTLTSPERSSINSRHWFLGTVSSLTRLLVLASQIGLVGAEGPSTALDVSPIDVSIGLGGSRTERSIP